MHLCYALLGRGAGFLSPRACSERADRYSRVDELSRPYSPFSLGESARSTDGSARGKAVPALRRRAMVLVRPRTLTVRRMAATLEKRLRSASEYTLLLRVGAWPSLERSRSRRPSSASVLAKIDVMCSVERPAFVGGSAH